MEDITLIDVEVVCSLTFHKHHHKNHDLVLISFKVLHIIRAIAYDNMSLWIYYKIASLVFIQRETSFMLSLKHYNKSGLQR